MTLIVRIEMTDPAGMSGTIELVRTGEKHRFRGLDAMAPLLERLVKQELQRRAAGV